MAGQMQPEKEPGLASSEQQRGGTEHPEDDLLLAYVNHQYLNNWIEIHKHILECRACQQKCLAYEQLGTLITSALQEQQAAQVYPSIADSVLERIERENAQSWGERVAGSVRRIQLAYTSSPLKSVVERLIVTGRASGDTTSLSSVFGAHFKQPRALTGTQTQGWRAPAFRTPMLASKHVAALVIFAAILSIAIIMRAAPGKPVNNTGGSKPYITAIPAQLTSPTVTPDHGHSTEPTPTTKPGQGSGAPAIQLCSTQRDINHGNARLCGSGFGPHDRVGLVIFINNNSHSPVLTADAQGNIQYSFNISSCKNVPSVVLVQDLTHPGPTLQLQKSAFGSCPASSQMHTH